MKNPDILPQEYQIDIIVEELGKKLNNHLETYFDAHETYTIDGAEEKNPVTYIGIFTQVASCYNADLSDPHAYKAAHEAFFFAAHVGSVLPGGVNIDADEYFNCSPEDLRAKMSNDARNFLLNKPAIAELIERFITDIDPTSDYADLVETFVAVTLMLIEESASKQYIAERLGAYTSDLSDISE